MKRYLRLGGCRFKHLESYARQIRLQSTISQRLSIAASPNATQKEILDKLRESTLDSTKLAHDGSHEMNGLAIFASKDFTCWLEDENFMSAFLRTLLGPGNATPVNRPSFHVLSGAMDGVGPYQLSIRPRSGFSVLRGPANDILPGLWAKGGFTDANHGVSASVSFTTNPLRGNTGALEVTLPSANTVFQNGRPSSLHASEWNVDNEGSMVLRTRQSKSTQRIVAMGSTVAHTIPALSLLPLTPPRKILAGLGNIVRQVEVDGSATPASRELEDIIPRIFEERSRLDPSISPRPMGVWCWVIPPQSMETKKFDKLKTFGADCSQTETDIISSSMELFSELLSSGCRLHKILSGGGGWGLKQGLLSLDPETTVSLPGQDNDIEMFIKSFHERNSAEPTSGIATPGSYLLFCAEPQMASVEALPDRLFTPTKSLVLGVAPNLDDIVTPRYWSDAIEVLHDYFGISSARGLFLRTLPDFTGAKNDNGDSETSEGSFVTKIDAPGTYFHV